MGRLATAFKAFFSCLSSGDTAGRVAVALGGEVLPNLNEERKTQQTTPKPTPAPKTPLQSDAIALLAALQREARLVDLIQEPLASYSDAQIGAAARSVLGDSAKVLERMFQLQRISSAAEESTIDIPANYDPARWKISGPSADAKSGTLVHAGWEAQQVNLPTYTGSAAAARVVAPAEISTGS